MRCPAITPTGQRGVSLVEALVALAVMSFGMLALVGVQTTMRFNSDVARQTSEASRIASEQIEQMRFFSDVAQVGGEANPSWDELASATLANVTLGNSTYTPVVTVTSPAGSAQKVIEMQVSWTDRSNTPRSIRLNGVVAGAAPVLSSLLAVPPARAAPSEIGGRHPSIPVQAVDLGNGSSAFKPFDTGTVVWKFNNVTGLITGVCTGVATAQAAITTADLTTCSAINGQLLAGTVQFDLSAAPSSESPAGPSQPLTSGFSFVASSVDAGAAQLNQSSAPLCATNSPATPAAGALATGVQYYCIVYPASAAGWGGQFNIAPATQFADSTPVPSATVAGSYKICRYTPVPQLAADSDGDFTLDAKHPKTYCMETPGVATAAIPCTGKPVTSNLINQNFLVILGSQTCPADNTSTPLVNGNTRLHQVWP